MTRYIAFLRGINVSGQKLITMVTLGGIFRDMKFSNVKTYIQSGNVIFDAEAKTHSVLTKKIEKGLASALGYDVSVILRSREEIEEIVLLNPFKDVMNDKEAKSYAVFVSDLPENLPVLPHYSPKKDVEIISIHKNTFFCLSLPLDNGRWGFPNAYIEKLFGVPATTRNWNTVNNVLNY